jgi:hypothetical protein
VDDNEPQAATLNPGERQELERLRAEVARLRRAEESPRAAPAGGAGSAGRARAWGRSAAAVVLILVAVVLAPLSVVSVWARAEVSDTDRYVETVAPLADDPAVQKAVATSITDQVFAYLDVQGLTRQAFDALAENGTLPPALSVRLQALAVPLANGVRSFAEGQVLNAVQSDVFATAWTEANRVAHEQLVAALTGESGSTVLIKNDAVVVDLAAFLGVVKERLISSGFQLAERIPVVKTEITIFQSADVATVQRGFDLLNTVGLWLPFVLVLLAGLGIYLAADHRLAFAWTGLGLAAAMFLTGAALALARRAYLDGVPPAVLSPEAAAVLYDTLVRFLRDAIRSAALVGLFAAAGAFLTGPSVTATTLRGWIDAALAATKGAVASLGLDLAPVTRWVTPRAAALRAVALVAGFLAVLLERYRTPELVVKVAIGVLVSLAIVRFLAIEPRRPRRRANETPESTDISTASPVVPASS